MLWDCYGGHFVTDVSTRLKKNGTTPGCSVAALCWLWFNWRLTGELSSTNLRICVRVLSPQCFIHPRSAFTRRSSMNKTVASNNHANLCGQCWFSMAMRLVSHLQMVGYLKCIPRRCIKSFEVYWKGGSLEPPRTPPAYSPDSVTPLTGQSSEIYYTTDTCEIPTVDLSRMYPLNSGHLTTRYNHR